MKFQREFFVIVALLVFELVDSQKTCSGPSKMFSLSKADLKDPSNFLEEVRLFVEKVTNEQTTYASEVTTSTVLHSQGGISTTATTLTAMASQSDTSTATTTLTAVTSQSDTSAATTTLTAVTSPSDTSAATTTLTAVTSQSDTSAATTTLTAATSQSDTSAATTTSTALTSQSDTSAATTTLTAMTSQSDTSAATTTLTAVTSQSDTSTATTTLTAVTSQSDTSAATTTLNILPPEGTSSPKPDQSFPEICKVYSNDSCYWIEESKDQITFTYDNAAEICQKNNGSPAFFPNEDAYKNAVFLIRNRTGFLHMWVWTGIRFNTKDGDIAEEDESHENYIRPTWRDGDTCTGQYLNEPTCGDKQGRVYLNVFKNCDEMFFTCFEKFETQAVVCQFVKKSKI